MPIFVKNALIWPPEWPSGIIPISILNYLWLLHFLPLYWNTCFVTSGGKEDTVGLKGSFHSSARRSFRGRQCFRFRAATSKQPVPATDDVAQYYLVILLISTQISGRYKIKCCWQIGTHVTYVIAIAIQRRCARYKYRLQLNATYPLLLGR